MARERIRKITGNAILNTLHPTINTMVLVVGIVVWAFNTFAQISYVKEQNQQILNVVESRHKDAIDHSDQNRERVLAVLVELRESMKSLELRILADHKG